MAEKTASATLPHDPSQAQGSTYFQGYEMSNNPNHQQAISPAHTGATSPPVHGQDVIHAASPIQQHPTGDQPPSYYGEKVATPQGQQPAPVAGGPVKAATVTAQVGNPTPLHMLGEHPQWIDCPFCQQRTQTALTKKGTDMQTIVGVLLCLVCVCLTCLPCMLGWFETVEYRCSGCNNLVAMRPHDAPMQVYGPTHPAQVQPVPQQPMQVPQAVHVNQSQGFVPQGQQQQQQQQYQQQQQQQPQQYQQQQTYQQQPQQVYQQAPGQTSPQPQQVYQQPQGQQPQHQYQQQQPQYQQPQQYPQQQQQ